GLALLLVLTLGLRPPGWGAEASALAGLLAATRLLTRLQGPRGSTLRDLAPVGGVLAIYLLLQPLVAAANPHRWDAALAQVDARLFGPLALGWRQAFGRPALVTDLVYGAYASFYGLPLAVALRVRRQAGTAAFERVVFLLELGFYLSFLGYFLVPAEGPRVPQPLEAAQLGGGAVAEAVRAFLRLSERTTLDAFPSGHTALSLLAAWIAVRRLPREAPVFAAWAAAVTFATVYLSLHYVVDVLAGILLVPLTLAVAGPLGRRLGEGGAAPPFPGANRV
ncbi:MAG TPA: phosphatase PAP2 family protein, partial [Holophagaceae bacterium]